MIALNRFLSFIKQHALFLDEHRVLLGVSGGRDSVLMAHFFKAAGFRFGIAHCNFNLRGSESIADEQFTSDLANALDVPFYVTTFNTAEYASKNQISIQMAARDLRYQWFEEIRADFDYKLIALAHHQNDVIETMLLNLTRGTGISGLHGILPKKQHLIRPLLFLTREEIEQICMESGFPYRDDRSNASVKYARNKIRLEVVPVLKELNPNLERTFEANRRRFAELEMLLEEKVEEIRNRVFKKISNTEFEIPLPELQGLKPLNTLLYGLFHPYGFTEAVLTNLAEAWNGNAGKVFNSAGYQLILDRNRVLLTRLKSSTPECLSIEASRREVFWNGLSFRIETRNNANYQITNDPHVAQLDAGLLEFPLVLRSWKHGDRFQPLGLSGKKKLSDFFIEQKVPLNRKSEIGILESKNGDIVWIAGLRIDGRYKITANTEKVFIFEQLI